MCIWTNAGYHNGQNMRVS